MQPCSSQNQERKKQKDTKENGGKNLRLVTVSVVAVEEEATLKAVHEAFSSLTVFLLLTANTSSRRTRREQHEVDSCLQISSRRLDQHMLQAAPF